MLKTVIAHIQFTGRHLESHTRTSRTLATPTEGDERYHVLFIGYLVIATLTVVVELGVAPCEYAPTAGSRVAKSTKNSRCSLFTILLIVFKLIMTCAEVRARKMTRPLLCTYLRGRPRNQSLLPPTLSYRQIHRLDQSGCLILSTVHPQD